MCIHKSYFAYFKSFWCIFCSFPTQQVSSCILRIEYDYPFDYLPTSKRKRVLTVKSAYRKLNDFSNQISSRPITRKIRYFHNWTSNKIPDIKNFKNFSASDSNFVTLPFVDRTLRSYVFPQEKHTCTNLQSFSSNNM